MDILPQIKGLIKKTIIPQVGGKLRAQFILGINALSLRKFESLNSNARTYGETGVSRSAQEMKMYRLLHNEKQLEVFYKLLKILHLLSETCQLNIDITTWGKFNVLTFATQTLQGRALPVWQEIIEYPIEKKQSQNLFILNSLHKFLLLSGLKKIGQVNLNIVCDRGFTGAALIHGFDKLGVIFTVRFRGNIYLKDKQGLKERKFTWNRKLDTTTYYHGQEFRIVRTSKSQMKKAHAHTPWHILTNDFTATRKEILATYYHRFEIEEVFKDIKQLLNTKPRWFKKVLTLQILLWFQILGFWMIYLITPHCPLHHRPSPSHKRLSWYRQVLESIWSQLSISVYHPNIFHYRRKREVFILNV
jgi:hypothetical protein